MVKTNIIAHTSILEDTVDALASAEIMQVDPVDDNLSEDIRGYLGTSRTPSRHTALLEIELRMERLLDIFSSHFPSQSSMLADLFPSANKKVKVKGLNFEELVARSESVMAECEMVILTNNDRLSEINDELGRKREKKAQISLLEPLDIPLDYLDDGNYTFTRIGTADDVSELGNILKDIPEVTFDHVPTGLPETPNVVVITGMKEVKEDVSKALRGKIFNELQLPELKGRPKQILAELNRTIERLEKEKERLLGDLEKLKEVGIRNIEVEMELVRIKREKYETYASFGKTEDTVVISGWVEEEKKNDLQKCLKGLKYIEISFSEPDTEKDTVPSSLSHSKYLRPFEGLINTFSPPKYNDFDPTPFAGVLFVLFFGMMLGDAGYGLIILAGCIWIGTKTKEGFAATLAYIGKYVAVITIITGLVTGSFFGDLIPRLIFGDPLRPLYPAFSIGPILLPYDPLRNPIPLFLVSLALGLITIYLSVILSTITHIKQKEIKTAIFEDFSLLILIPSLVILIINMLDMLEMPSNMVMIGFVGVGSGLVLANIKKPVLALFDVTGFIGDLLSFARILALGLATVGLAMTWNIIAEMFLPLDSVLGGIIKMVLILIILLAFHTFNFLFQTLGACIHSLRLQYIELFNRCYSGGGVLFKPFKEQREFTESNDGKVIN
ncbi:MAG: V-type ATP synthase subunit I [Candidatus Thermoplasmatota archaeon]|jgi:V/A-type H+-transporting ATPase subunit I|nr:V-type ATP synthase subunit I [Candidatus Thermoplasmatota archaeon]